MQPTIRVNNPQQNPQPMAPQHSAPQNYSRGGSKAPWVVLIIVVIVFLGVLGYLFRDKFTKSSSTTEKSSGYQAVFLNNGQVYFGKLSNPDKDYVTLKDIYYLQVNQSLQNGETAQQQQQQQPQLSLVKLGNELHGPVDLMKINRSQILFYEDLKSDGKVAQAIAQYQANPNAANQTPAQTQTQQQSPANTTPQK